MKRLLVMLSTVLFVLPACAAPGSHNVQATVDKTGAGGNSFKVIIQAESSASVPSVWKVLTDYERHKDFLPYMTESKVVYQNPEYNVVDQAGKFRMLFWTFNIRVKQKTRESAPDSMRFQAVDGDFTQLDGHWRLAPRGAQGTRLFCEFQVQPKRRVPGWAMRMVAKRYLGQMVSAICERAEKNPV
jgi:ribosome-associated toxin RatA of RatAB toxin-antitoxin module